MSIFLYKSKIQFNKTAIGQNNYEVMFFVNEKYGNKFSAWYEKLLSLVLKEIELQAFALRVQKKHKRIRGGVKFLSVIYSYSTETEIFQFAALEQLKKSVKEWQKKMIKTILLR